LIRHRINVNGIAPGVIDTPMWEIVDAQFCKYKGLPLGSARKMAEAGVPHGRFGVPDDLAGAPNTLWLKHSMSTAGTG
jgi:NAD(P)-dependent dehydrogenase (short-subunit alcohol dehydrogenase family)